MCTNQRRIVNKYTGKSMYVNCGHCPACLQQKAAYRVQRIKLNERDGYQTYMLSLTYARYNCPYVLRDEAYKFSKGELNTLNVYRDTKYRWKRYNGDYDFACFGVRDTHILCSIDRCDDDVFTLKGVKDLKHEYNHIGVCYYPDVQKFFARLRLNLKRNFKYDKSFSAYICSEYGTKSLRSHFHIALNIPKDDEDIFRAAIDKSWPFSNILLFPRAFEKAFRASSYLASYVNSPSDFPRFLKLFFPPKHSYSKGFGCGNKLFSLDSILERFYRGHLTYFTLKTFDGLPTTVECPIPKYIISRYFPLVKGYGRFTGSTQFEYLTGFTRLYFEDFCERFGLGDMSKFKGSWRLHFDADELRRIGTRLLNAWTRYNSLSSDYLDYDSYILLHQKIWNLYKSDCLRLYMQDNRVPLNEKYDNLDSVRDSFHFSGFLPIGFSEDMLLVTDPNKFVSVQQNTAKYANDFAENIKHRNVSNLILSDAFDEF